MDRWETYQLAGMMPSTGQDCWLEYPWGEVGALRSMQDLGEDAACTDYTHSGKWLLYFPMEQADAKWKEGCEHFEAGNFLHVHHIRIGTWKENLRAPPGKRCMVLFVDSSDPLTILRAGLSIVKNMKYRSCCFYKTNQQSKQAQDPAAKKFLYYIRPECHNAQPEWILRRFFNRTSRSEEATN